MHHPLASLTIRELTDAIRRGDTSMIEVAGWVERAAERITPNHAHLHFDPTRLRSDAEDLARTSPQSGLHGLPVSVKDLMDVAGVPTTCGSRWVAEAAVPVIQDAAFVAQWRRAGVLLAGKTHLNEHAYGITGENPWFGDCTQPSDPGALTGGSSSGAAATVQGGSAWIGLGTDTGGSLRVPASLCGLVSLRAPAWFPDHRGTAPLAPSFDTLGWVQRWLSDVEYTATSLMGSSPMSLSVPRIRWMTGPVLNECDAEVLGAFDSIRKRLMEAGFDVEAVQATGWEGGVDTLATLQAMEVLNVHHRTWQSTPEAFSPAVRARLDWAASITAGEAVAHAEDRKRLVTAMDALLEDNHVLMLPAAPMTRLVAGADHGSSRRRIITLTAPASLGVHPVLTVPDGALRGAVRVGYQFIAGRGGEWSLIRLAGELAQRFGAG